jgi:hypothetical protein
VVSDHGSANLSQQAVKFLEQNDIELLPAGPANPKGNGSLEGAFSKMKQVIGSIKLSTGSAQELAKAVLEKIITVYINMRNRTARCTDVQTPRQAMSKRGPEVERQQEKARLQKRKLKPQNPDQQGKLDRLAWLRRSHGLAMDEVSLKRAEKCIVAYDLTAISKTEEAFLKAVRRDPTRCNIAYFFGILKNIQNDLDIMNHKKYCQKRYNYVELLKKEQQEQQPKISTTIDNLIEMLQQIVLLNATAIKEVCIRQAKRMTLTLKNQYEYVGVLKKKIENALFETSELTLEQRQASLELVEQFLT